MAARGWERAATGSGGQGALPGISRRGRGGLWWQHLLPAGEGGDGCFKTIVSGAWAAATETSPLQPGSLGRGAVPAEGGLLCARAGFGARPRGGGSCLRGQSCQHGVSAAGCSWRLLCVMGLLLMGRAPAADAGAAPGGGVPLRAAGCADGCEDELSQGSHESIQRRRQRGGKSKCAADRARGSRPAKSGGR